MDQVFGFVGWAILPSYATQTIQSVYYKLTVPVGRVPPQPGTPIYAKHHRNIRIIVLTLYLLYTLVQSLYDVKLAGDFFTLLSATPSTPDREIRTRFRRLAAKFHPDKFRAEDGSSGMNKAQQDVYFQLLKTAQDTLLSEPLRFAYTRFGPSITQYQGPGTPTIREYVFAGVRYHLIPSYFANIAGLVAMNYLYLPKWGSYWRYLALSSIVVIEMYFLTHSDAELAALVPSYIPITQVYGFAHSRTKLGRILPPHLLPYQILIVLRKLSISLNIFISQLAPQLSSATPNLDPNTALVPILGKINQNLSHIHQIAMRTDAESTSLLQLQMAPFKGDEVQTENLREGMKQGMLNGAIRQNAEVGEAVNTVVARRKREAQIRRPETDRGMDDEM